MLADGVFDDQLGTYRPVGGPSRGNNTHSTSVLTALEETKLRRVGLSGTAAGKGLSSSTSQTRSLPILLRAIRTMRRLKVDQDRASEGADAMRAAKQIELTMRANALSGSESKSRPMPKATAWESIVGNETYNVGAVSRPGESPSRMSAGAQIFRAIRSQEQTKVQKSLRAARSTGQLPSATQGARQTPASGALSPASVAPHSPSRRSSLGVSMSRPSSPGASTSGRASPSRTMYGDLEADIAEPVAEQVVTDMDYIGAMGVLKDVSDDEEGMEVAAQDAEAMYVALAAAPAQI